MGVWVSPPVISSVGFCCPSKAADLNQHGMSKTTTLNGTSGFQFDISKKANCISIMGQNHVPHLDPGPCGLQKETPSWSSVVTKELQRCKSPSQPSIDGGPIWVCWSTWMVVWSSIWTKGVTPETFHSHLKLVWTWVCELHLILWGESERRYA